MVSSGGGGESMSYPKMFPGGKQTLKRLTPEMWDIVGGDFNNPIAKVMYNIASNKASQGVATGEKKIAETPGLTSPQKAKAMTDLQLRGVEEGAKAGLASWQEAFEFLEKLAFGVQGQISKTEQSGSFGLSLEGIGEGMQAAKLIGLV